MFLLFQGGTFRFHVSFRGCTPQNQHGSWTEEEIPNPSLENHHVQVPLGQTFEVVTAALFAHTTRGSCWFQDWQLSATANGKNKTHVNKRLSIFFAGSDFTQITWLSVKKQILSTLVLFFSQLKMALGHPLTHAFCHITLRGCTDFVWGKGTQPRIDGETEGANGSVFCEIICANKCVIISYNVNNSYHYCSSNIIYTTNF